MRRVNNLVGALIQTEIAERTQTIESLLVRSLGFGRVLVVVHAVSVDRATSLAQTAYTVLAPIEPGEIIAEPCSDKVWSSDVDGMPLCQGVAVWQSSLNGEDAAALTSLGFESFSVGNGAIVCLVNELLPVSFQALQNHLLNHSWLGEPQPPGSLQSARYSVTIGVGVNVLAPQPLPLVCSMDRDGILFSVGRTPVETDAVELRLVDPEVTGASGKIRAHEVAKAAGVASEVVHGYEPRASMRVAAYRVQEGPGIAWRIDDVARSFLGAAAGNTRLREELETAYQRSRERVVERLESRLSKASERQRLVLKIPKAGCPRFLFEAANEMETVWLTSRIEDLIASTVWPDFRLLDYTSRDGIDAVVECRLSKLAVRKLHPLEFEYDLRNFFRHAHPVHQVSAIICWSSFELADGQYSTTSLGGPQGGDVAVALSTQEMTRALNFGSHVISVLCLDTFLARQGYVGEK